jgi:8-hydroxy-5-deazaflavin:NADPH oxidoreductase
MKQENTIGIIGTGRMGVRLAKAFADEGHRVILGSRDVERARKIVSELGRNTISAGSYEESLNSPWVLPAIFTRDGLLDILEPYRKLLDGKFYIDITNPFNDDYSDFILPWNTSSSEQIQLCFPKTRVIGAFKNVWWEVFDAPDFNGSVSDVFVVGDDVAAKEAFLRLMKGLPFRFLDSGGLKNARTVERMTLFSGELGQGLKYFPRMNYKLLGEEWTPGQAA